MFVKEQRDIFSISYTKEWEKNNEDRRGQFWMSHFWEREKCKLKNRNLALQILHVCQWSREKKEEEEATTNELQTAEILELNKKKEHRTHNSNDIYVIN